MQKNPELKNIFVAAGIAVFAGVLVLGVNAAFGVSAPTINPEDAGLVGPTFSEVTTTDLDVRGEIVNGNVGEPVVVNGPFEATDVVTIGNNTYIQNEGDLTVEGDVDVWDTIKNTSTDPTKPGSDFGVAVDDKFQVSGLSTFGNDVNVIEDLSIIDGNIVVESGTLDVSGAITANRFGTYNVSTTLYTMQPAEPIGWKYLSKACPTGQILVSCGGGRDWGALEFGELYPGNNDNTCYLEIHKQNVGYYAYAHISTICLDPDA